MSAARAEAAKVRAARVAAAQAEAAKVKAARTESRVAKYPVPVQCLLCCCCWTGSGLREMLTHENTIDYALGFILGENFGRIIQSIVTELVTPVFNIARFLLRGSDIVVHTGSGWLCVEEADRDNSTAPLSAEAAALTGCEVINYKAVYEVMLTFVLVMISTYWVISWLRKFAKKEHEDEKLCTFCCSKIPIAAVRCCFCSSWLVDEVGDSIRPNEISEATGGKRAAGRVAATTAVEGEVAAAAISIQQHVRKRWLRRSATEEEAYDA